MSLRMVRGAALALAPLIALASPAAADPPPADPNVVQPVAAADPATAAAAPGAAPVEAAVPDLVPSSPPESTETPDGWIMTISARDETQRPVAPLTTAISTREFAVGGVYNGTLVGGDTAEGAFEVGYQIGCGINLGTVNLGGNANIGPSIGFLGLDFPNVAAEGFLPGIGGTVGGLITVGLEAGQIASLKVSSKEFKGLKPWISVSNFRIKVDECVGEAFIRSYAVLVKSTDEGDAVLSWYGVTKQV